MEDNRSLICRICHNYLKCSIRQCAKDKTHNFCKICIEKFDECVVCGGNIPFKMDASIEKVLLTQNYPCKFSLNGCQVTLSLQLKAEHENECIYRTYKCEYTKFTNSENCLWKGPHNQISTHFRSHVETTFDHTPISLPMKLTNPKTLNFIQLVHRHNEIFWYKHYIDCEKQKIFFLFQLIGTKQMASEFYYKIEIISKKDPNLREQITKYCLSDSEDAMTAFNNENCVVLSFRQASYFILNDELSLNYYIQKKNSKKQSKNVTGNKEQSQQEKSQQNQTNFEKHDHKDSENYKIKEQTANRDKRKENPNLQQVSVEPKAELIEPVTIQQQQSTQIFSPVSKSVTRPTYIIEFRTKDSIRYEECVIC